MTKKVLLFAFLILSLSSFGQKAQRIGYIDMEYILENVPEYNEAQTKINAKAIVWQNDIEVLQKDIDNLKAELNNERVLLTNELIDDKEEDIQIKELDLKKLQASYFGVNGDLYMLRQQLVKPLQDMVYNAIQDIAAKRKYDFILDKSSDLIMLYTNKKFDVSDIVINSITRAKKANAAQKNTINTEKDEKKTALDEKTKQKIDDRNAKKEALKKKIEERKAAQLKKREELKKAIEEKRQKRIKEIEAAKKAKEEKNKNN